MRIDVTQDDIANGIRKDPCWCPIALAVRRATGAPCKVDTDEITLSCGAYIPTPESAAKFVMTYDDFGAAIPFSFELEIK